MDRSTGSLSDHYFYELPRFLRAGDLLVLNDTKVFRAKLSGRREDNGAALEVLLLREHEECVWEVLVKPARKAKANALVSFGDGQLRARVVGKTPFGGRVLDFTLTPGLNRESFLGKLAKVGQVPVPPYIKSTISDDDLYQTVYAREVGSVAAPTAGFHFTEALLRNLVQRGVEIAYLTLHVGLGTFRPVKTDQVEDHVMHEEHFAVPDAVCQKIRVAREKGGRTIAVGTTVVRALESCRDDGGFPRPTNGWTSLFITPGYRFRYVDGLITNFHLPRTSLLILVCAFAGRERVLNAYAHAIERRYRFYSFGDAMLIV